MKRIERELTNFGWFLVIIMGIFLAIFPVVFIAIKTGEHAILIFLVATLTIGIVCFVKLITFLLGVDF
jgi:hypothetical protein